MVNIHGVVEGTPEDVARRAAQEAEATSQSVIAAALYIAMVCFAVRATWLLLALAGRVSKRVWYYWTKRRHIERAKKRE